MTRVNVLTNTTVVTVLIGGLYILL